MPNIRGKTAKSRAKAERADASADAPVGRAARSAAPARAEPGKTSAARRRGSAQAARARGGEEREGPAEAEMGQRIVLDAGAGGKAERFVRPGEARRARPVGQRRRRIRPRRRPRPARSGRRPLRGRRRPRRRSPRAPAAPPTAPEASAARRRSPRPKPSGATSAGRRLPPALLPRRPPASRPRLPRASPGEARAPGRGTPRRHSAAAPPPAAASARPTTSPPPRLRRLRLRRFIIRFPTSRRSPTTSPTRSSTPGKAMAAYLRPRETGEIKTTLADEVGEMVRSIGHVAEYYMSDPKRGVRGADGADHAVHQPVGRDAAALPGHAGDADRRTRPRRTSASRTRSGATIRSSISSSRPMC